MFSVSGTESIPNGWSKRMLAVEAQDVGFDIVYRMRSYQYGPRPVRFYLWRNDAEHKLGDSPLPDGRVNLYRQTGEEGGLTFLARQNINYVPIKAEIEINIGTDDLVVYESQQRKMERLNFHFHWVNQQELVDGWDEKVDWLDTVRNYRTKPIKFELRRQWAGDVEFSSEIKTTLFDYRTTEMLFSVEARAKTDIPSTALTHGGTNAKQQRVLLNEGK